MSDLDKRILDEIKKQKLSEEELEHVLKGLKNINPRAYRKAKIEFSDKRVKYGVISDAHIGHICYRPDIMDHAAENFKREGIEFIVNPGDTIEGMSGRDGHIYELTNIGASSQMDYFASEMKKLGKWPVYSIENEKSHSGWFKAKGNMGLDIGQELARRAPNYKFLGYDEQDLVLSNGLKIRLRHPGDGTAYAVSYKMQKYIESIGGGDKPNIVHDGHYHKALYMFYRNVHGFESGTLANQTPFMKSKNTPAHVGYWIVDVSVDKRGGVEQISPKFVPFYD